jgi:hypothetical protein
MARPGLDRNVKFRTLVRRLGLAEPFVRGLLETMWEVGYECGNPVLGAPDQVEAAAKWPGTPGVLFEALKFCRLIDELPVDRWQIHDLMDHAPEYVKKRMARESRRTADNGGQRRTTADNGAPPTPTPTPTPTPSGGKNSPRPPSCPEPPAAASGPAAPTAVFEPPGEPPPAGINASSPVQRAAGANGDGTASEADPVVLLFPVVGGNGGKGPAEWPLRHAKVAEYQQAFPGLDVLAHCRRALQWARDNPAKRKTFRGMPAFLWRWLAREQDRGHVRPAGPAGETAREREERVRRERAERAREEALALESRQGRPVSLRQLAGQVGRVPP